jgi:hypothetical protein
MTVESGTEPTALVERLSEAFNTKDALTTPHCGIRAMDCSADSYR